MAKQAKQADEGNRAERKETTKRERQEKLIAFLNEHWQGSKVCPICKKNNWNASGDLVELRVYTPGGGIQIGGPVVPIFPITCMVCGHTMLFNAIVTGTEEAKGDDENDSPPAEADEAGS